MGTYINIGNAGFRRIRNSEYVDKTGLIAVVISTLFTEHCLGKKNKELSDYLSRK